MVLQRITHAGAAPPTNLVSAITATAMSFALASSTGWPTGTGGPFVIDIDAGQPTEEKILCSSLSGGTITVLSRGWDNTVATAHAPGTALAPNVTLVFSAAEADDANSHIYDTTRNDHTQYALTADTGWQPLGLGAGFSANPAPSRTPPAWRCRAGFVYLQGSLLTTTTIGPPSVMVSGVSAPYRTAVQLILPAVWGPPDAIQKIWVNTDGSVYNWATMPSGSSISLDSIVYPTN